MTAFGTRVRCIYALIAMSVIAACQPASSAPGSSPAPRAESRLAYIASDGSLSVQNLIDHSAAVILKASSREFYDEPVFSPDGARIMFVDTHYDEAGRLANDIRSVRADGGDARVLFSAPAGGPLTYFSYPRYIDGGVIFSIAVSGRAPGSVDFQVVRGAADGGAWSVVIDNASEPFPAPDGSRILFLRTNPATTLAGIWIANADGSGVAPLIPDNLFADVSAPRFTPDGGSVVFAASGPPSRKLSSATADESCALSVLSICLVSRAEAHGMPADLWQMNLDSKRFRQLTRQPIDSPGPAFSTSGAQIAYITASGTFAYDRERDAVLKLSDAAGRGALDWFER